MRITSKGQVTIPQELRERFGLMPETEVEFIVRGSVVQIVRKQGSVRESRGGKIVKGLRGRGRSGMSTDQIMALTRK